jgi:hypothetical protein
MANTPKPKTQRPLIQLFMHPPRFYLKPELNSREMGAAWIEPTGLSPSALAQKKTARTVLLFVPGGQ